MGQENAKEKKAEKSIHGILSTSGFDRGVKKASKIEMEAARDGFDG